MEHTLYDSYGEEFGENGYFYVSYDDFSIEQVMLEVSNMEEDKSNAVKYSYQYDELGGNFQIGAQSNSIFAANVFKKQDSSHVETLSEVGITLKEAEGVEVYVQS